MNYKVSGGKKLSGEVVTNRSKNAAVALLAASLLNRGTTTLKKMPRIEEVSRLIEVLESIGVSVTRSDKGDVRIVPPDKFDLTKINREAARKTRSIAMFIGPLAHALGSFELPVPGGCELGGRTMVPPGEALARLGIRITNGTQGMYRVDASKKQAATVVMYEASDTGTENALMAAAKIPDTTTIKFASSNYQVQDLCLFLRQCGVS